MKRRVAPAGIRRLDAEPSRRLESEPPVVLRVPEHDDDPVPRLPAAPQPLPHETRAGASALVTREHSQRRERDCRDRRIGRLDDHRREKQVADHRTVEVGDQ
jgi:hypothetical protein